MVVVVVHFIASIYNITIQSNNHFHFNGNFPRELAQAGCRTGSSSICGRREHCLIIRQK